jgi:hypothetical protein
VANPSDPVHRGWLNSGLHWASGEPQQKEKRKRTKRGKREKSKEEKTIKAIKQEIALSFSVFIGLQGMGPNRS